MHITLKLEIMAFSMLHRNTSIPCIRNTNTLYIAARGISIQNTSILKLMKHLLPNSLRLNAFWKYYNKTFSLAIQIHLHPQLSVTLCLNTLRLVAFESTRVRLQYASISLLKNK